MFIRNINILFLLSIVIFNISCKKDIKDDYTILTKIPEGFPSMEIPTDNEFTIERWELGKLLFYEKKLSVDYTISCSSCHKTEFAFSDNIPKTPGVNNLPGSRNAPTLTNIGFQPYFTKEGGVPSLEQQVLIPIEEHNEMGFNVLDAGIKLNSIENYKQKSLKAYNREMDYYVITRALACFERSFISSNSKYDQYLKSEFSLSESATKGKDLFFSIQTNCSSCHSGILFTGFGFFNNGLYQNYEDVGKFRLTMDSTDIGVFKVPTLRNISVSGPYMHDGSISSLKEVVNHYNSGGSSHVNKDARIKPLYLNETEINDLTSFLETLTDYNFINNKLFNK